MKKPQNILLVATFLLLSLNNAYANTEEVFKKKGYKLTFIVKASEFDADLKKRLVQTFFKVYPKLTQQYNPSSTKDVTFIIDDAYDGVAYANDGKVVFSANYMKKHPQDIDVVTHEVMHLVQSYPKYEPGWLTEGIADYVRYKYGVDNESAKWALPTFTSAQSYKNSYRITARFLAWLESTKSSGIVSKLNESLHTGTYTPDIWVKLTGNNLDELWQSYAANPTF